MKKILIGSVSLSAVMITVFLSCNSTSTSKVSIQRGEKIYTQNCLPCHQADGSGVPQLNPPLKSTSYVLGDESRLIRIVINGSSNGVEINGDTYTNPMPAFGVRLKNEEIADVLTYVRNNFGNKASEIAADQVKALRK
jgi:mono/diheme cytochrome c family protein